MLICSLVHFCITSHENISFNRNSVMDSRLQDSRVAKFRCQKPYYWHCGLNVKFKKEKILGLCLSFKEYPDVVGFVATHHLGEADVEKGSTVKAVVMDISNTEGVVDLSLKREFISNRKVEGSSKKVLLVPEHNYAIEYASIMDYNTQKLPSRKFDLGQSILVTVGELPNPDSCNRLLLLVKHIVDSSGSKRTRKSSIMQLDL